MSFSGDLVEFPSTVLAWHSIVYFKAWHHVGTHTNWRAHLSSGSSTATTTAACISIVIFGLAEGDRLACCSHHGTELMRLRLSFRYRLSCLSLFDFLVDLGSSSRQYLLITIDHSLLGSVEDLALLAEHFLADVLMPGESFWIERPAAVVALFKSISSPASAKVLLLLAVRVGVRAQIIQVVSLFGDTNWLFLCHLSFGL